MSKSNELHQTDAHSSAGAAELYRIEEAQITLFSPDQKSFSILDLVLVVARNYRLILLCVVVSTAVATMIAIKPEEPRFVASATLVREGQGQAGSGTSRLGGLSALGYGISGGSVGLTPAAYPEIMTGRSVRLNVVRDTFFVTTMDSVLTLVEYLDDPPGEWTVLVARLKQYTIGLPSVLKRAFESTPPSGSMARIARKTILDNKEEGTADPSVQEERAMAAVARMIQVAVNERTGLMSVTATTPDPGLSADLVSSFVEHFSEEIQTFYTEKARRNLEFITISLGDAERELRAAEQELVQFIDRNAGIQTARLRTEQQRLERDVQFKTQMFGNLQSELMQSRLELQNSIPVVTVVERAVPPLGPIRSNPGILIIFGLVFGCCVGIGLAFCKWFIGTQMQTEEARNKIGELRTVIPARLGRRLPK